MKNFKNTLFLLFLSALCLAPTRAIAILEEKFPDGQYYIISKISLKAVAMSERPDGSAHIFQSSINNSNFKKTWNIRREGANFYIKANGTNGYLGLETDQLSIINTPYAWNIVKSEDAYSIQTPDGRRQLNLAEGKLNDGAEIISYQTSIGENTQWLIVLDDNTFATHPKKNKNLESPQINIIEKKYKLPALPAAVSESNRLLNSKFIDYYPSGLYVNQGEKIHLKFSGNRNLSIILSTPASTYSSDVEKNNVITVIPPGNNIDHYFTPPFSGLMYFRYIDYGFEKHTNESAVVQVLNGGTRIPLYVQGKTDIGTWKKLVTDAAPTSFIEILGKKSLITVKKDLYLKAGDVDPNVILNKLDRIIENHDAVSGLTKKSESIDSTPALRVHYVQDYFSKKEEIEDVYMYATDYMIGMPEESALDLLIPERLDSAWSIWHETGHLYQQHPWTWEALTESSVNIFSLQMQKNLNIPLRIDDKSEGDSYRDIAYKFKESDQKDINDNNLPNGEWIRLVMLDDLGKLAGNNFYARLSSFYRKNHHDHDENNDSYKINQFAYNSSLISGLDLTDFFSEWKFILERDTINKIKDLQDNNP